MPILSLLDERAKPKGSRDPLGFELVWTNLGRKIIGNLTTITTSLENFAVALLGFKWANEYAINSKDKVKDIREYFLKYEQITGYMRNFCGSDTIMGINRIKKKAIGDTIPIGNNSESYILSNQASYGLWGLYSSALRATGLIEGEERILTPNGYGIINDISESLNDVRDLIPIEDDDIDSNVIKELSKKYYEKVTSSLIKQRLIEAILTGKEENQGNLWEVTQNLKNEIKSSPNLSDFIDMVINHNNSSDELKISFQNIVNTQKILALINNIFHYCRSKDGSSIDEIVDNLKSNGFGNLQYEYTLPEVDFPRKNDLRDILNKIQGSDLESAVKLILTLNKNVMKERQGAPWVEVENGNKLRVKIKDESKNLELEDKIITDWSYDYFIGSFINIAWSFE